MLQTVDRFLFCLQKFGLGGAASDSLGHNLSIVPTMKPVRDRPIKVAFEADVNSKMKWNFRATQSFVKVNVEVGLLAAY